MNSARGDRVLTIPAQDSFALITRAIVRKLRAYQVADSIYAFSVTPNRRKHLSSYVDFSKAKFSSIDPLSFSESMCIRNIWGVLSSPGLSDVRCISYQKNFV